MTSSLGASFASLAGRVAVAVGRRRGAGPADGGGSIRAAFAPPFSNTTDTGAPPCENPTFGTTPVACIGRGDHVIYTRLDVLCKFSLDMTPNFNALDAPARCSVLSGM